MDLEVVGGTSLAPFNVAAPTMLTEMGMAVGVSAARTVATRAKHNTNLIIFATCWDPAVVKEM